MPFDVTPRTPLAYRLSALGNRSAVFIHEIAKIGAMLSGSPELAEQNRQLADTFRVKAEADQAAAAWLERDPTCACVDALCGHNDSYGKHSQEPVAAPGMLCGYCQEENRG